MPSPVPAGYTRGPILFVRSAGSSGEEHLWQRFWTEAGAYGSRIAVLAIGDASAPSARRLAALLESWESEQVTLTQITSRAQAVTWSGQESGEPDVLQRATAIAVLCEDATRAAALLGGTPLAQEVRRANARNKAIVGAGSGAAILCQHIPLWTDAEPIAAGFAPGLGLVNRLLLDITGAEGDKELPRVAEAAGTNPFLVGVNLSPGSGVVIYPNAMLEVFGESPVLIVDGAAATTAAEPGTRAEAARAGALAAAGVATHRLAAGGTFNFDTRQVSASALSSQTPADKAAF